MRAWLGLLLATACAPEAALWVRVEAPLRVPEDCDALELTVTAAGSEQAPLFHRVFALEEVPFPHTLMLVTDERALADGRGVQVVASALKEGTPARTWSTGEAVTTLSRRETASLTVRLCDCP